MVKGKPNNFVIDGNTVRVELTQEKYGIIDLIDIDLLTDRWHTRKNGRKTEHYYAVRNDPGSRTTLHMHRIILERMLGRPLEPGEQVDHINHDGLDNKRENLRLASHAENVHNSRVYNVEKSSRFKGVSWDKRDKKWRADIQISGKSIYLGYFDVEEDARDAYDHAAIIHFGKFAWTNAMMAST